MKFYVTIYITCDLSLVDFLFSGHILFSFMTSFIRLSSLQADVMSEILFFSQLDVRFNSACWHLNSSVTKRKVYSVQ